MTRTIERSQIDTGFEAWGTILLAFAGIVLVAQIALFGVIGTNQPLWCVFATQGCQFFLMATVLWGFRPAELQRTNAAQKQLWAIWIGFLLACGLVAVISHVMLGVNRMYDFFLYPYWATLSGLAFLCMGGYWGWFYIFGMTFFAIAVLCSFFPIAGPLLFGGLWSISLSVTGVRLRKAARRR